MAFFAFNPRRQSGPRPHPQTHPFWDFVASMDNDFSDMRRPPSYGPRDRAQQEQPAPAEPSSQQQEQEKANYRAPSVQDEKMADADARPAKRDLADAEKSAEKDKENSSGDERWGRRCRRGGPRGMHHHGRHGPHGRHGSPGPHNHHGSPGPHGHHGPPGPHGHHGPPGPHGPPFGMFGIPFGPGFSGDFSDWTPPHHPGHHGPRGHHHRGPPPPPPGADGVPSPPQEDEPRGSRARRHCRGGAFGRRGAGRDFNVAGFLTQLGERLGIDLNAAAGNLGLDLSRATGNGDVDFTPSHDLFNLADEYLVHVSLPGARREDLGLDFDSENQTLRVGGVVYRPGVDENITSAIVHSGRNREVGVFETRVHLPSSESDTFEINVADINAKLRDGVLMIHVPKIQKKKEEMKRNIRIETPSPSPEPETSQLRNLPIHDKPRRGQSQPMQPATSSNSKAKETAFPSPNADLDMYYSTPSHPAAADGNPGTEKGDAKHAEASEKQAELKEKNRTPNPKGEDLMNVEDPPEQLPAYTPSHQDDEDFADGFDHTGEDEEGEYVKINVD